MNKVIIFSAPSGSGKTTIIKHLMGEFPTLQFSVSATSRAIRGEEQHGVDYFFLSPQEFSEAVAADRFVEWEEVYAGTCYGTLKSEVERIWAEGGVVVFDVDVVGGTRLKKIFGEQALSLFIMPPSVEELRNRLVGRATDTPEAIEKRVAKATQELEFAPQFDRTIINDNLASALEDAHQIVAEFTKI